MPALIFEMNIRSLNPAIRFAIFVTLIVLMWLAAGALHIDIEGLRHQLSQYPLILSGTLFIILYVGLTSVLWVGTIDFFRIIGAFLFGAYWSTLLIWIAEVLNASILFHISRNLGRDFIQQKFNLKDTDLKSSENNSGFWGALVLRINPLVPFRFMDLGFGLTKIPFPQYFWAVVIGSPLRILGLQFILAGVGEAILKDPMLVNQYLMANPTVLMIWGAYLIVVIIATIAAGIAAFMNKRKKV